MYIDLLALLGGVGLLAGILLRRRRWGLCVAALSLLLLSTTSFLTSTTEIPASMSNPHEIEDLLFIRWAAKWAGIFLLGAAVAVGARIGTQKSRE